MNAVLRDSLAKTTTTNDALVRFGPDRQLTGVLSGVQGSGPILLLPSAGLQPRAGPFRLHAELAGRLAARGIRSFRYDVPGVGEAPRLTNCDATRATIAAIDQLATMHGVRREQPRDRERGPDRIPQGAAAQPHLALALQVDRGSGEVHGQGFDQRVADHLAHRMHQPLAMQQAGLADRRIQQAQEIAATHPFDLLAEFGQLAGGEDAADQRVDHRPAAVGGKHRLNGVHAYRLAVLVGRTGQQVDRLDRIVLVDAAGIDRRNRRSIVGAGDHQGGDAPGPQRLTGVSLDPPMAGASTWTRRTRRA